MQEFLSISLLIILAAISPGPDFAIVTKNSLLYSRKAGIYTAFGISVSLLVHAIYCILGLALIISQSLLAFSIIKYLGAAYLIYIGIKGLLAKREVAHLENKKSKKSLNALSAFYQGLLCNLLNPKAIMFLLAFFTLIVKPGHSLWAEMSYGFEIAVIHMIWFSSLSILMTHQAVRTNLNRIQFYIIKAMGALLVAFGVRIATLSQTIMLPTAALE
jgi:RhtB (resistance to homoserine/threonine) family protein